MRYSRKSTSRQRLLCSQRRPALMQPVHVDISRSHGQFVRLLWHTAIKEVIDGEEEEADGKRRHASEIESSKGEVPRQSES
jgi:hypothetical protein